jgi:primosomal protein N' (replication factor Y)
MIARVAPLTRTRAVRGLYDYRLEAGADGVGVGSLLRVRFGRRQELAVVVELAERSQLPDERLLAPEAILPAVLPAELVELARWMAREYCSTLARCLALMLPPGAGEGRERRPTLIAALTPAGAEALRARLDGGGGKRSVGQAATTAPVGRACASRLAPGQRQLLEELARCGPLPAARLGTAALRRLERRGLVRITSRAERRAPTLHEIGVRSPTPPDLTTAQRAALAPILQALGRGTPERFLLHGVTGSGKTEIYLQAVAEVLARGRSAIVLVPEIALTPQVLARFHERLGDLVAVLHSGLRETERGDEWRRLRSGEARVCVGPRSAALAPLERLGLMVIDEEHESSYKHEGDPRYDARTVAARRAEQCGAVLLLGSATPRPESYHEARRLRLAERVDGRPLPAVEVLDMRGVHGALHPESHAALADLRRAGGKAIVLLNRRGWSNFLTCRSCGHVWMCRNCEVTLVLYRAAGQLACHHCGHREPIPRRCPACRSISVARHGVGTERLEHELREALGGDEFPVLRLDADAPPRERGRTLERFQAAGAGVLVGTQMVAKGHDFPDVGLGLVLDAEQTLRFPDFRAEERTFALICQLAGRTGRGREGERGRVLVQTLAPDARCIALAARHDSEAFLAEELERRRALAYPPFATLIRVVCAAREMDAAFAAAAALRRAVDPPGAVVLGPARLFALRGRARAQLLIKAGERHAAVDAVGAAVDALAGSREARGVAISVDVDPQ